MSGIPPVEGETVIRDLNSTVKIFSAPFSRSGTAEIGVRMSAIKTASGVVLYNPTNLDSTTRAALDSIGAPIKFIIAPNLVHHSFIDPYAAAYPDATFILPDGLHAKHLSTIHKFVEVKDSQANVSGFPSELELAYFPDFAQKEIFLFDRQSKTVFVADMLWHLPAIEQYSQVSDKSRVGHKGFIQNFVDSHMNENDWVQRSMQWAISKNTEQFKHQADRVVNAWQPIAVVTQHGDVIATNGNQALKKRFEAALKH